MARLVVKNFCCINAADVKLAPLTVLIGPQASGKSIISKLTYFFYEAIASIYEVDFDFKEQTFDQYSSILIDNFKKLFPPQAWGGGAFSIEFISAPIGIKLFRSKPRKNSIGTLRLMASEPLQEIFHTFQADIKSAGEKISESKAETGMPRAYEFFWKVSRATRQKIRDILGEDFVSSQLFIPAGRSFFTSMGKAVVAFEHGGFLDPLTMSFGKQFLVMRDHISGNMMYLRSPRSEKVAKELANIREKISEKLFSGKIRLERNEEYLETSDGRKIPFSYMSSGQQELLPLWLTLNEFFDGDSANFSVYIEEPEAHLFPFSQGVLTEYLVTLLASSPGQKMLITTHSPYILAKINNLLKAGSLAARTSRKAQNSIENILPKSTWLRQESIAAYAIKGGDVVSIIGDDGLIDGDYLDGVSDEISRELNNLLEIQYAK
jgi:hypothetical protein